ncbi:hypothetical protein BDN71DRAFT_1377176, partial [Pleurotus eryngii]
YVARVSAALRKQEKTTKGKRNILFGDGMPQVLSDENFIEAVKQKEVKAEKKAKEKVKKFNQKMQYAAAIIVWKNGKEAQRLRNQGASDKYHAQLVDWQSEVDAAKRKKRRAGWMKPKRGRVE